jgi:uncharacterized surface protein with fasciclin (FAS1) repeats
MGKIESVLDSRTTVSTFNALSSLLHAVGLDYDLEGMTKLTFFAPPDEAFSALQHASPYDMLKDVKKLRRLLTFHLVPLALTYADLNDLCTQAQAVNGSDASLPIDLETLSGYPLRIHLTDRLMIGDSRIIQADVPADNGIIHIIAHILWPPELDEASFERKRPFNVSQSEAYCYSTV